MVSNGLKEFGGHHRKPRVLEPRVRSQDEEGGCVKKAYLDRFSGCDNTSIESRCSELGLMIDAALLRGSYEASRISKGGDFKLLSYWHQAAQSDMVFHSSYFVLRS